MKIATWNVNSVRQRTEHLLRYLRDAKPDVLCLQELKCLDSGFPHMEVEAEGYNAAVHGQKGFNGVAILAKSPVEVTRGLPGGPDDEQARYIEAVIPHGGGIVRVASIYLPNGNPPQTEKYSYKLAFMDRLIAHARNLLALEEPLVLAGDYNVIPTHLELRRSRRLEGRCAFFARNQGPLSIPSQPRPDRRPARNDGRRLALHILGLPGGCVATQQRHPHRSSLAFAASGGPASRGRDRQGNARRGKALGSRAGAHRIGVTAC